MKKMVREMLYWVPWRSSVIPIALDKNLKHAHPTFPDRSPYQRDAHFLCLHGPGKRAGIWWVDVVSRNQDER
jgi:hypothetical protein